MAIELLPQNENAIELEEFIEYAEEHVDMKDQDTLAAAAPMMKALSNNRTFLATKINSELEKIANFQEDNLYGAQVLMLGRRKRFFMRACFWPSESDKSYQQSGPEAFFYYLPHDHNFNFLSVGYFGPGYESEYYEYDHDKVIGLPGEKVDLKYIKTSRLHEGKVMLYRAKKDIHYQIPPKSFSISLNLMEDSVDLPRINQYRFDLQSSTVNRMINRNSGPVLASIAAEVGNENTIQLLTDVAERVTCPRTKTAAVKALSSRLPITQQATFLSSKLTGKSDFFNESLKQHIQRLEA
ncbi:transposase [Thalassotalea marina]|uniref:Uncharacterized protein n=1 Tax=Thalassotalea marina TaxID=1673741 RepID=A0A919BDE7_9GAMM|nr:transposase [Thalassotalea marina]GHF84293.1 hypothetical protein GCM10017161_09610 [Thalassotalea marina]